MLLNLVAPPAAWHPEAAASPHIVTPLVTR